MLFRSAIDGASVTVKGPKGTLSLTVAEPITVSRDDSGALVVVRPDDERKSRSLHGLTRTLISNMVVGVTEGYTKTLEISGTGYTAGGALIPSPGISTVLNSNAVEVNITDVIWPSSTLNARGAILYSPGASDAASKVIAYVDFGTTVSSNNSALTIDFQTPLKLQN